MKVYSMSNAISSSLPGEIHIVPIGEWKERGFRITAEDCGDILRNFTSFGIDLVIDYEHQSLNSGYNGAPAPAAGWIKKLEIRDNGVFAVEVEWTDDAKALIEAKKYKYISPVIVFNDSDPHDGSWIGCSLHSVALTNTPYFRDDLEPLINSRYNHEPARAGNEKKEKDMSLEEQVAALKVEKEAQAARIAELETQVAAKDANLAEIETAKMVDEAIAAKKLLPAQKEVGLIVAKQGKEAFDKFIAANIVPNLETKNVEEKQPESADPRREYQALMQDPAKMEKMKKENPEAFGKLRDAYYGGK